MSEKEIAEANIRKFEEKGWSNLTRDERIHYVLSLAVTAGRIDDYMVWSPDGRKRWSLNGLKYGNNVFSTKEAEAWCDGFVTGYC